MADLSNFRVTDFVTDVLAVQYNRVIDSALRGELSNVETLAADKTLVDADYSTQVYATSAARVINLPAIAAANHPFYIVNTSAFPLTVKNAGGTTVDAISPGGSVILISDATAWRSLRLPASDNGGWVEDTNTWTYASASTFTVAGDQTAIFTKSLRIRWKQGAGYLYGVVVSSSYGAPNTTVTIVANSTYPIANAAITDGGFSNLADPRGWPSRFDYALSIVDNGGWVEDVRAWTYASASTFTVPGDQTAIYTKGSRLRWKQGAGYLYGIVSSSSYGAPNTTVTIVVNTDYVVANAAITDNAYSFIDEPQGWPGWFNYTAVYTGFSADPTTGISKYNIKGLMVTVVHRETANGTSNAATFTVSLPVTSAFGSEIICGLAFNSGTWTGAASASFGSSATAATLMLSGSASGWATTLGKRASFQIIYGW